MLLFFSIDDILAESDSDDEIMENNQNRNIKKNKFKTWITENSEDIVDLFDPTAMSKISSNYLQIHIITLF